MAAIFRRPGTECWWVGYYLNGKRVRQSLWTRDEPPVVTGALLREAGSKDARCRIYLVRDGQLVIPAHGQEPEMNAEVDAEPAGKSIVLYVHCVDASFPDNPILRIKDHVPTLRIFVSARPCGLELVLVRDRQKMPVEALQ
jgi:hypothetical protein